VVTVGPYAKDDYMPMTDDNPLPMLWYTMTQNVFLKKLFWVHSIAISVSVCLSVQSYSQTSPIFWAH